MSEDIVARLREGSRYRVLDGEAADEIERLRADAQNLAIALGKSHAENAELRKDRERVDWLEGEFQREQGEAVRPGLRSLFRLNQPITRAAIDAAMREEKP